MQYVATFITDPKKLVLDERILNRAFQALEKLGGKVADLHWLSPTRAADIVFHGITIEKAQDKLRSKFREFAVDIALLPREGRRKKLLVADMDSTLIQQECIDELADTLGLKKKVAAITERAMNGELDFAEALTERVALLKGLPEKKLQEVYTRQITLMPGGEALVGTMKKFGARTVLVSGGFSFFTSRVARELGFDVDFSNVLEIAEGRLTGTVKQPILGKEAKLATLKREAAAHSIPLEDTLAVGDGANDLPMLLASGLGVAYHAKPSVQQQVACHINHADLISLLYLQGYKDNEIV